MVNETAMNYLIDFLYDNIKKSIPEGYGKGDNFPKKDKKAELCNLFETYVYTTSFEDKAGFIYIYNGKYYEQYNKKEYLPFLRELIKRTLKRMNVAVVYQKNSSSFIAKRCISGIENRGVLSVPDRNYIAFNNGVLNLETEELNDFNIKYRTDFFLDIDYNKNVVCKFWEEAIASVIPYRHNRKLLQMFCGTFLIKREKNRVKHICYLIGPRNNGKVGIASAIVSVFGKQYFCNFLPKELINYGDSFTKMTYLYGKIVNFTNDLDKKNFSTKEFKRFVQSKYFNVRSPYTQHTFYMQAPLLLCCTNEMPITMDDNWEHGIISLPICSTTKVWNKYDNVLCEKLSTLEARTAIFNWIYDGYKQIIANTNAINQELNDAKYECIDDINSICKWIRDMKLVRTSCVKRADSRNRYLSEWYGMYSDYCKKNGERNPMSAKSLSKTFIDKGFIKKHSNKGVMYCIGQLNVDTDENGNSLF